MSVFDVGGGQLLKIHDINGTELSHAYDVNGINIYSKLIDYTNYSYVQIWNKGITPAQGFGIYDGKVFWAKKSGNDSVPTDCYVWNLSDGSQALDVQYVTIYAGHGNNLVFDGTTCYASTAYNPATVYENTLESDYSFSLTKTFVFANVYDIDACIDENDSAILWGISHNYVPTELFITKWDLTDLTDNGDGTFTPNLLHSVSTPRPSGNYMQGTRMHDGMLWYACGNGTQRAYVYAVNPNTGDVVYTIDLETNTEPEGLAWVEDANAVGGYVLYVGFQGMSLKKYTFAQL